MRRRRKKNKQEPEPQPELKCPSQNILTGQHVSRGSSDSQSFSRNTTSMANVLTEIWWGVEEDWHSRSPVVDCHLAAAANQSMQEGHLHQVNR